MFNNFMRIKYKAGNILKCLPVILIATIMIVLIDREIFANQKNGLNNNTSPILSEIIESNLPSYVKKLIINDSQYYGLVNIDQKNALIIFQSSSVCENNMCLSHIIVLNDSGHEFVASAFIPKEDVFVSSLFLRQTDQKKYSCYYSFQNLCIGTLAKDNTNE